MRSPADSFPSYKPHTIYMEVRLNMPETLSPVPTPHSLMGPLCVSAGVSIPSNASSTGEFQQRIQVGPAGGAVGPFSGVHIVSVHPGLLF